MKEEKLIPRMAHWSEDAGMPAKSTKDLLAELDMVVGERDQANGRVSELLKQRDNISADRDELANQRDGLQASYSERVDECIGLQDELNRLEKELAHVKAVLSKSVDEYVDIQSQATRMMAERNDAMTRCMNSEETLRHVAECLVIAMRRGS